MQIKKNIIRDKNNSVKNKIKNNIYIYMIVQMCLSKEGLTLQVDILNCACSNLLVIKRVKDHQ